MSEIKEMLLSSAGKIMKKHCTKEVVSAAEQGKWPEELWERLSENGMNLVGFSEEAGGLGGDLEDALSLLKLAGYYSVPVPLSEIFLGNWLLSRFGRDVEAGILSVATTPDLSIPLFRQSDGDDLIGKVFTVPWGRRAEAVLVPLRDAESGSYVLIRLTPDQYEVGEGYNLANEPRDKVKIVAEARELEVHTSQEFDESEFRQLCKMTRVLQSAGAMDKVLEETIAYSKERSQFGRPISKFQAIKQQIAVLAGEVVSANSAAEALLALKDLSSPSVDMAKISVDASGERANEIAHQILGAMGFTNEHTLHFSTRRLWAWQYEYGGKRSMALTIGRAVTKEHADLWNFITSQAQSSSLATPV